MEELTMQDYLTYSPYFVDNSESEGFDWNKFQDKLDKLPEQLLDFIFSDEAADFVNSRREQYKFEGKDLARVIRDLILGDLYVGDLVKTVSNKLNIGHDNAEIIANLIVGQLLKPVIEEFKKTQAEHFKDRVGGTQKQAAPSSPTATPAAPKTIEQIQRSEVLKIPPTPAKIQPVAPAKPEPKITPPPPPNKNDNIIDLRHK